MLPVMRIAFLAPAVVTLAMAGGFTFDIGSPVAAQEAHFKSAAFVFRTQGCADPAKADISASAEGMVRGGRRSMALKVAALQKPGVYAVFQEWGDEGKWVVVLKGACASETAGAIVPIGPKGFVRESSKFFPRAASAAEIDRSVKALAEGEQK
jgi:hypothetical protein